MHLIDPEIIPTALFFEVVTEGILNRVEMAFRLYDPCFGYATHTLPGQMPLTIRIHDSAGELKEIISR